MKRTSGPEWANHELECTIADLVRQVQTLRDRIRELERKLSRRTSKESNAFEPVEVRAIYNDE
jgi:hypothetical protein